MEEPKDRPMSNKTKRLFLILSAVLLVIGDCGGPLVIRLYFLRGGKRVWLSSFLVNIGWPIILLPLLFCYIQRRLDTTSASLNLFLMTPRVFLASSVIGILTGADNYLYAFGVSKLPVSTSTLINALQLAFTALFSFFIVRQKFTPFSLNAVVLLTISAGVLALGTGSDRPKGESKGDYLLGFIMTVAAAALYGLMLPMIELTYKKAKMAVTYTLVLEMHLVMSAFASVFSIVGMIINKDFQAIPTEAKGYELGEKMYYVVLISNGLIWQSFYLGAIGVIFSASSLLSAILVEMLLPVTQVLAVVFYKEKFQAEKAVSLILSLWGFAFYFYGETKSSLNRKSHGSDSSVETEPESTRTEPTRTRQIDDVTPTPIIIN